MLMRIALWGPLVVATLLVGAYIYVHKPLAPDATELLQVPLSEEDPSLNRVGDLKYLGGLDIPRMGQNIGGLSGLRWDAESKRLLAITDDARWVWMVPVEEDGRLTGVTELEVGQLLGIYGEPLEGKQDGDSEALYRDEDGVWGVAFERHHRVMRYLNGLSKPPFETIFDPEGELEITEPNNGLESYAVGSQGHLMCAERLATQGRSNCNFYSYAEDRHTDFAVSPPEEVEALKGVPTDADALSDGTFLILFRSYSPAKGNTAAIVAYEPDGTRSEIATFLPPLTIDNFEGLAVREEGDRTFLYIVSDDNFSSSQRTLLMKFELLATPS
ncbi:esterase-like activity of phytase family protein [uncultured Erythrobacter sp.]|uniref:esterase-like activity of phytase family protein n=1 Tax=uncultured Erythrobacter sp. TaxID=263913 RepID=UPI00260CD602|nr:esterase-like activity of phytase family protein [uncultured Erythrobacter sp.]